MESMTDYAKRIFIERSGFIIKDPYRQYIWNLRDPLEPIEHLKWKDFTNAKLKKFAEALKLLVQRREAKYFVTSDDLLILDLFLNIDDELLLENKELMRKFETTFRFFRSLIR